MSEPKTQHIIVSNQSWYALFLHQIINTHRAEEKLAPLENKPNTLLYIKDSTKTLINSTDRSGFIRKNTEDYQALENATKTTSLFYYSAQLPGTLTKGKESYDRIQAEESILAMGYFGDKIEYLQIPVNTGLFQKSKVNIQGNPYTVFKKVVETPSEITHKVFVYKLNKLTNKQIKEKFQSKKVAWKEDLLESGQFILPDTEQLYSRDSLKVTSENINQIDKKTFDEVIDVREVPVTTTHFVVLYPYLSQEQSYVVNLNNVEGVSTPTLEKPIVKGMLMPIDKLKNYALLAANTPFAMSLEVYPLKKNKDKSFEMVSTPLSFNSFSAKESDISFSQNDLGQTKMNLTYKR